MRATRASLAVTVAAIALIALPSAAAATPFTFTDVETFSESFADERPCAWTSSTRQRSAAGS